MKTLPDIKYTMGQSQEKAIVLLPGVMRKKLMQAKLPSIR